MNIYRHISLVSINTKIQELIENDPARWSRFVGSPRMLGDRVSTAQLCTTERGRGLQFPHLTRTRTNPGHRIQRCCGFNCFPQKSIDRAKKRQRPSPSRPVNFLGGAAVRAPLCSEGSLGLFYSLSWWSCPRTGHKVTSWGDPPQQPLGIQQMAAGPARESVRPHGAAPVPSEVAGRRRG